jgi:hypothetical protein
MDPDLSGDLTGRMPIVPHGTAVVDCCAPITANVDGNVTARVDGCNVELRCNECLLASH